MSKYPRIWRVPSVMRVVFCFVIGCAAVGTQWLCFPYVDLPLYSPFNGFFAWGKNFDSVERPFRHVNGSTYIHAQKRGGWGVLSEEMLIPQVLNVQSEVDGDPNHVVPKSLGLSSTYKNALAVPVIPPTAGRAVSVAGVMPLLNCVLETGTEPVPPDLAALGDFQGAWRMRGAYGWPFPFCSAEASGSIGLLPRTDMLKPSNCILYRTPDGAYMQRTLADGSTETASGDALPFEGAFPKQMHWVALAGNVLVFTAIALALWALAAVPLHLIREARGQCLHCGYNRKGLGPRVVCPECGK